MLSLQQQTPAFRARWTGLYQQLSHPLYFSLKDHTARVIPLLPSFNFHISGQLEEKMRFHKSIHWRPIFFPPWLFLGVFGLSIDFENWGDNLEKSVWQLHGAKDSYVPSIFLSVRILLNYFAVTSLVYSIVSGFFKPIYKTIKSWNT